MIKYKLLRVCLYWPIYSLSPCLQDNTQRQIGNAIENGYQFKSRSEEEQTQVSFKLDQLPAEVSPEIVHCYLFSPLQSGKRCQHLGLNLGIISQPFSSYLTLWSCGFLIWENWEMEGSSLPRSEWDVCRSTEHGTWHRCSMNVNWHEYDLHLLLAPSWWLDSGALGSLRHGSFSQVGTKAMSVLGALFPRLPVPPAPCQSQIQAPFWQNLASAAYYA